MVGRIPAVLAMVTLVCTVLGLAGWGLARRQKSESWWGEWGPPALADESTQLLRDTGANLVASTLLETRKYLAGLVEIPRIPVPETNVAPAA